MLRQVNWKPKAVICSQQFLLFYKINIKGMADPIKFDLLIFVRIL